MDNGEENDHEMVNLEARLSTFKNWPFKDDFSICPLRCPWRPVVLPAAPGLPLGSSLATFSAKPGTCPAGCGLGLALLRPNLQLQLSVRPRGVHHPDQPTVSTLYLRDIIVLHLPGLMTFSILNHDLHHDLTLKLTLF